MAAILHPNPGLAPLPSPPRRPDLRLIPGGRHPARVVYRRRRLMVLLLVVLVVVGAVAVGRGAFASLAPDAPAGSTPAAGGASVTVQPGDTLWSIAQRVQPSGDVRSLVDRLAAQHGAGPLHPGERLNLVP
ncbi:MAG: hypothetical protein JWM05_246 [Acidimicrobiales bacterium]|nr:hypothetical protein [Acidimicrobiales bacterium]